MISQNKTSLGFKDLDLLTLGRHLMVVNDEGQTIGLCTKEEAHKIPLLHRAFSVVIFREESQEKSFLLQRRHFQKYHTGGLWSNTCCSHPWPGVSMEHCVSCRLLEEMGIEAQKEDLLYRGSITYNLPLGDLWEKEWTHVYELPWKDTYNININPQEVHEWMWMSSKDIVHKIHHNSGFFTPWFPLVFKFLYAEYFPPY